MAHRPRRVDRAADRPPRPLPKHELFGFVPYWEMNDGIADHLAQDAADDPRPLLGHAHQDRQDRHEPDRLQADHRRDRQAAHPRGARPRRGRPARLHELRHGAQQAPVPTRPRSRTRRSRRSSRSPIGSVSTASTSTSSCSTSDLVPAYGAFVGRLREALRGDRSPTAVSRWRRRPGATGAAMAAARRVARGRPDLPDGLRLPLRGLRRRRIGTDGPARRRREGPRLVARPVRGGRRPGRQDDPRAAAVRDALARGRARRSARRGSATGRSGSRPTIRASSPIHRRRPSSIRSRSSSSTPSPRPSARYPATRGRPPGGRRSTSIRRAPSSRSWRSPTTAAWPGPGSGRSATSGACPATRKLMTRFAAGEIQ